MRRSSVISSNTLCSESLDDDPLDVARNSPRSVAHSNRVLRFALVSMACGRSWSPADCCQRHSDGHDLRRWAQGHLHQVSDSHWPRQLQARPTPVPIRQPTRRVRLAHRIAGAHALWRSALSYVFAANPNCLVTAFGLSNLLALQAQAGPRQGGHLAKGPTTAKGGPCHHGYRKTYHQLRRRGIKRARRSCVPIASPTSPLTSWSRTSVWRPAPVAPSPACDSGDTRSPS
jgi:hypothetical protein